MRPSLIKKENIISGVTLNNNIICVNGSLSGNLCFYGQGAGGPPTASAMFDDLINIILFCKRDYFMPQYAFTQKKEMKRTPGFYQGKIVTLMKTLF